MTRKIAKPRSISRRRLLTTAGAGVAIAASPFRINLLRAEEANIKIGFPVPLTGPYGTEAQDQVRAGQLAVAQFNDAGGLNGRKAELVVRDDKLNPGEAATRTLELVASSSAVFPPRFNLRLAERLDQEAVTTRRTANAGDRAGDDREAGSHHA